MWARLAVIIGEFIGRAAVREAAKEIATKFGMTAVRKGFTEISKDLLKTGTKEEIIDAIQDAIKSGAITGIDDAVFSKSNAKKLADILNKSVDFIEKKTQETLIKQWAKTNNQTLADTLATLSGPGEPIDVLGIEIEGKFIAGIVRSKTYNRLRNTALESLRAALVPKNKKEAFTIGYIRGILGEGTANTLNSLLLGTPRVVLGMPKARAFVRTLQTEVEFLRTTGQVKKASELAKALSKATAAGRNIYGPTDPLVGSKVAGYVSGRLTIPVASTYVFVDGDERKKNIDKLQNSIKPYAKKQMKTWVDSYTRSDGITVRGHYRQLEVAA